MATTLQSGTLAAANATLVIDVGSETAYSAVITGTFSGTVTFQVLYDPTEGWVSAPCFTRAGVSAAAGLTAAGSRLINVATAISLRAIMSPFVSGAAAITLAGVPSISVSASSGGGGGASTIADGADFALGTTTDAAIVTSIAGTVIGFLRGSIVQWAAFLARFPAALISGRLDVNLGAAPATVTTQGDVASGSADSGNPVKQGFLAISHGSSPTTVSTGQRVNGLGTRLGVQFVAAGHPNTITTTVDFTGVQTNATVVTNAPGTKLVILSYLVFASAANTVNITASVGLAQAVTPASGVAGRLGAGTIAPSSGFGRKTYQAGADGDLLLTTSTGAGNYSVQVEYYLSTT